MSFVVLIGDLDLWIEIQAGDWLEDDIIGFVGALLVVELQVLFFLNFFLRILRLHLNAGSSCRDSGAVDANRGLGSQLDVALLAENSQLVRLIVVRYSSVVIDGRFASHFGSKEGRG